MENCKSLCFLNDNRATSREVSGNASITHDCGCLGASCRVGSKCLEVSRSAVEWRPYALREPHEINQRLAAHQELIALSALLREHALLGALALLVALVGCAPGAVSPSAETEPAAYVAPAPEAPSVAPVSVEPPRYTVVAFDPRTQAVASSAALEWNAALGWDALTVVAPGTPCVERCVRIEVTEELPEGAGGHVTGDDFAMRLALRPDCVGSLAVIGHELGHVLGGDAHSDDVSSAMYWTKLVDDPFVINETDVNNVLLFMGFIGH